MAKEFPDINVLGPDYNLDDMNKAQQQTAAVLERERNLAGVFGTNVFSAQGAGTAVVNAGLGGHVQVVAYDATKAAIELMNNGVVSLVLAQKPFDMGYMGVQFAQADAAGVTSLPRRVETGFAIIDKDNVKDPAIARFIYQTPRLSSQTREPDPSAADPRSKAVLWDVNVGDPAHARGDQPAVRRAGILSKPGLGVGFSRADGRLLRRGSADCQQWRGQFPDHPEFAKHPRRDHPGSSPRDSVRPSSLSARASIFPSAGS